MYAQELDNLSCYDVTRRQVCNCWLQPVRSWNALTAVYSQGAWPS